MQKIIIQNFNQISLAEIEVTKFVCLIGEQASGKSTIAKVIYLFKSLKLEFLRIFFESNESDAQTFRKEFIRIIKIRFIESFGSVHLLNDKFELKYYFSYEQNHWIKIYKSKGNVLQISFSDSYWSIFSGKLVTLLKQIRKSRHLGYSSYLLQSRTKQTLIESARRFVSEMFHDDTDTLFFPAGRSILSLFKDKLLPVLESSFLTEFNNTDNLSSKGTIMRRSIDTTIIKEYLSYLQSLKEFYSSIDTGNMLSIPKIVRDRSSEILKGVYKNEAGKERIYYDDKHFVPLNLASSGQQDAISIILDVFYIWVEKIPSTRIIEEPETHLFPNAQRLLMEMLLGTMNETGTSFIITTHSPYILAAVNNLLYLSKALKSKSDCSEYKKIFCVEDSDDEFKRILSVSYQDVRAYNLVTTSEQYCVSMIDEENHLIGDNLIDASGEKIYGIFDNIYDTL